MILSLLLNFAAADSLLNSSEASWTVHPHYEIGALLPITNTIQLGENGTDFDYLDEGGQNNLFRYQRFEMGFQRDGKHHLDLIFQPFDVTTTAVSYRALQFDNASFEAGTPMEYRYGFDYFRGTYLFDTREGTDETLGFGIGMQIRNAAFDFRSQDGEIQNDTRDIGLVPLLTSRGRFDMQDNLWWGYDAAGSFAPFKYMNGSNSDVLGAILDASIRGGVHLEQGTDVFLNLRYIGGGAEGTTSNPDRGKDGYTSNWVNFTSVTVGFLLR